MYRISLITTIVAVVSAQTPFSNFCLQQHSAAAHTGYTNPSFVYGADQQNHFPDTTDCHYYIQCDFINKTFATGTRVKCPEGQFWRPAVVSCLPEGDIPCVDRCLREDANHPPGGCYAGTGCRQFFVCANTASYGMCCPLGTNFVETTCACEESSTCNDACVQVAPSTATTVKPSQQLNATVCKDSFGSTISTVPGEDNAYILLTDDGIPTGKQYCATGTVFDFGTCRCDIDDPNAVAPPTPQLRKATVLLTFDSDINDSSPNKFQGFLYNGAEHDTVNAAQGTGSLAVNGGLLTVPGTKSIDLRSEFSACLFFRGTFGGLLSNSRNPSNQDVTFRFGLTSPNTMEGTLKFWHPAGIQTFSVPFTNVPNSWNHCCVMYSNNLLTTYVNGQVLNNNIPAGYLAISHSPLRVGSDPGRGSWNGNIDEVLLVNFALTPQEVALHRSGNYAALNFN